MIWSMDGFSDLLIKLQLYLSVIGLYNKGKEVCYNAKLSSLNFLDFDFINFNTEN